jgi:hypothetical protein
MITVNSSRSETLNEIITFRILSDIKEDEVLVAYVSETSYQEAIMTARIRAIAYRKKDINGGYLYSVTDEDTMYKFIIPICLSKIPVIH